MKETFTYNRKQIAAIFLVMFSLFVFTPTVTVLVDSSLDVSMFFSVVEEEEENTENHKSVKNHYIRKNTDWALFLAMLNNIIKIDFHREKDYAFVLMDQFCPPPELS